MFKTNIEYKKHPSLPNGAKNIYMINSPYHEPLSNQHSLSIHCTKWQAPWMCWLTKLNNTRTLLTTVQTLAVIFQCSQVCLKIAFFFVIKNSKTRTEKEDSISKLTTSVVLLFNWRERFGSGLFHQAQMYFADTGRVWGTSSTHLLPWSLSTVSVLSLTPFNAQSECHSGVF